MARENDDDEQVLEEARARYSYALAWESEARKNWLEDLKFGNGDSENLWQWPDHIRLGRESDKLPNLTINKTRQHCLQIVNDARQNKPSVRVRPVSDEASTEAAEVFEGIVRHIEYQSKAQVAYDTATMFQVYAGLGFIRIETAYADEGSFDQEIYIRRVRDPLTVLLDPDAAEADYSDSRFAFVFEDVPRDAFDIAYPKFKGMSGGAAPIGGGLADWVSEDHVRVAEYWRRREVADELLLMVDPETGNRLYARRSAVPAEILKLVLADKTTKRRDLKRHVVEHFVIIGDQIAKREPWAGVYIPVIPVIGEETIIERRLDRKGHVRALRDPQRMYNYWSSETTSQIALQTKSPYIAPAQAIEGYEEYWKTANTTELSVLPYNNRDDDGNEIPPPQRNQGAIAAPAYLTGMQVAANEMMMVSGQYQAQLGSPSNEVSGRAISERQRQGDNATYHYIDNLAVAIRQVGRVILDLIPKIYDQPRVLRILGEDGEERKVLLDPNANSAFEAKEKSAVAAIFNPAVGKYDVQADIGPSYSTQRQEAWNAFVQISAQSPMVMAIAGDLMFKAADFPMADEIAERFKRTISPSVTGEAPPEVFQQAMAQAQQQIQAALAENQQLKAQLQGAAAALTQKDLQLTATAQKNVVDVYRAETDRMKALGPAADPHQLAQLAAQLVLDAFKLPIGDVSQAAVQDLTRDVGAFGAPVRSQGPGLMQAAQQPMMQQQAAAPTTLSSAAGTPPPQQGPGARGLPPGAQLAPDGQHYVADPRQPGKYLMVVNG